MNIWKELKAFRDWLLLNEMPSSAITLWYTLFTTWNMAGCQSKFSVPNSTLMNLTGLSKQGLINARATLVNRGLIHYERGKKEMAPKYGWISLVNSVESSAYQSLTDAHADHLPLIEDLKERRRGSSNASTELFVVYEQNFGNLPPAVMKELHDWCDVLGQGIVLEAVLLAVKQGGRSFSYVEKILTEWQTAGVKTLDDVRNYISQFRRQNKALLKKQVKQQSMFDSLRSEVGFR